MPRIISFSWTSPAIVARRKSVTRRDWNDNYARLFRTDTDVIAYDRSPRAGGQAIADLRLIESAYQQMSDAIPEIDWLNEGFDFLSSVGAKRGDLDPLDIWNDWLARPRMLWVVRFKILAVY
jgi:hypothetical protein